MTDETGSTHAGDTTPDRSFRVKLYKLDSEGTWEDQGTGYCIYKTVIYPSTTLSFLRPSRSLFDLTTHSIRDRCDTQCRETRMSLMRSLCAPSETRRRYSSPRYWISRSITVNKVNMTMTMRDHRLIIVWYRNLDCLDRGSTCRFGFKLSRS